MRSSASPAALALLALPMAVSARPRCQSVYPVAASASVPGSSHSVGYNVSSHVVPSASGPASAYPASSASASASLASASHPASYSVVSASASYSVVSASASAPGSASISSAGNSASLVSASSAPASYSGSASASYSASASSPYSLSASVSYSASASASISASNSASSSASSSASATASNSASASASASSYPIADMGPAFCIINDAVISAMNKAPEATAFCSSYLSIPTQTTTVTATQTPADITVTVPATITGEDRITAVVTATSTTSTDATTTLTVTVPSTVTVTSTTSTAVLTCLNGAYTASEPVGTVPAVDKRIVAVATPTCLPTNWASAAVSRACSCLSVPAATATTTVTQTLAPGTATATTTDVLTPTVTATETAVETQTSMHTETTTVTDGTVTATAYAEATSIAASGLQYRRWEHPYDANEEAPGYTANYFKGRTPLGAGTLRTPTFRGSGNLLTLPTTPAPGAIAGAQAAVLMQGFFVARQTGTYTLWSGANDIDNWGYLWTGAAALADWRDDNTAFKAVRTGRLGRYTGGITYVTLQAGDAVPVAWLWANGGGDAASFLGIRGPDGGTSTDGADFFVQPCDDSVFQ